MLKLDCHYLFDFLKEQEVVNLQPQIDSAYQNLKIKVGPGNEFLGWMDIPSLNPKKQILEIEKVSQSVYHNIDYLLIIGIGGSYLGTRAVISALQNHFHNLNPSPQRKGPILLFAGHHLDPLYHQELLDFLKHKTFAINVISKSGSTLETLIAFRLFQTLLEQNVGQKKSKNLIFVTTNPHQGPLKAIAESFGFKQFHIPENVVGRYSVLTPVSLFPFACAGFNIQDLLTGAFEFQNLTQNSRIPQNITCFYAACRYLLYKKGKKIELLVSYSQKLNYFLEWWKQLFGESEGKNSQGLFPATSQFTTDLHSIGQWIQQGEKSIFQTILNIQNTPQCQPIPHQNDNLDQINFLQNQTLNQINQKAWIATSLTHFQGKVPNMTLHIPEINARYLGQLIYFFQKSCAISGYLLRINPFDQPGVENYKSNLLALLKKPGLESKTSKILRYLQQFNSHQST